MKSLRFLKQASSDIEEIYLYGFINFGERQADLYAANMEKTFSVLQQNPEIGRLDARVQPAIRRFNFESHVIFYDVHSDHISVVRILHRHMDFVKHLGF